MRVLAVGKLTDVAANKRETRYVIRSTYNVISRRSLAVAVAVICHLVPASHSGRPFDIMGFLAFFFAYILGGGPMESRFQDTALKTEEGLAHCQAQL
jgi:hypothetical protein